VLFSVLFISYPINHYFVPFGLRI